MKKKKALAGAQLQQVLDVTRKTWERKPITQIVRNKKAEQRRTMCRKGHTDGAVVC